MHNLPSKTAVLSLFDKKNGQKWSNLIFDHFCGKTRLKTRLWSADIMGNRTKPLKTKEMVKNGRFGGIAGVRAGAAGDGAAGAVFPTYYTSI